MVVDDVHVRIGLDVVPVDIDLQSPATGFGIRPEELVVTLSVVGDLRGL